MGKKRSAATAASQVSPKRKAAKKRATQKKLDKSFEDPSVPAIDKAAAKYVEYRDERMRLNDLEVDAKVALIESMHDAKLTAYKVPGGPVEGYTVDLKNVESIKVNRPTATE